MATRNIVPRANGEGQLGTAILHWSKLFADAIHEGANLGNNASLGYRQPSTAYTAGAIAYHSALPTGWYLECITTGISGSGDLSISSPSIGGTLSDGTVTWKIGMALSVNGGTMYGNNIRRGVANSLLALFGGNAANNAVMQLYGGDNTTKAGNFELIAASGNLGCSLTGKPTGWLTWDDNDLAGSAIVAKSLGTNGYIKYASGLIVQWGKVSSSPSGTTVTFPVSFTSEPKVVVTPITGTGSYQSYGAEVGGANTATCSIYAKASINVNWFAIGY